MASSPTGRITESYDGDEESTPRPQTTPERLVRVETRVDRHASDLRSVVNGLQEVISELRDVVAAVNSLTERKKFHDKLILAAATLLVAGLLAFLLRLSWWVQSAKLP